MRRQANAGRRIVQWSAPPQTSLRSLRKPSAARGSRHGSGGLRRPVRLRGALACQRSITALAAANEHRRSAPAARPGAELLRNGRYPLPAAIQFTRLRSVARASAGLASSSQAGRSAGWALPGAAREWGDSPPAGTVHAPPPGVTRPASLTGRDSSVSNLNRDTCQQ